MDSRLVALLARLQSTQFADLQGSEAYTVLRIGQALLNESVATFLANSTVVRAVTLQPRAANVIDVQLKLARPAFLPAFNVSLQIEQQPQLPDRPELALRLTGAGGLLRLAGPAIGSSGSLPRGIRLDGDRILVNVLQILEQQNLSHLLQHLEQVQVLSEEGRLVLATQLRVR